jgi:hypothetical protein
VWIGPDKLPPLSVPTYASFHGPPPLKHTAFSFFLRVLCTSSLGGNCLSLTPADKLHPKAITGIILTNDFARKAEFLVCHTFCLVDQRSTCNLILLDREVKIISFHVIWMEGKISGLGNAPAGNKAQKIKGLVQQESINKSKHDAKDNTVNQWWCSCRIIALTTLLMLTCQVA